MKQESLSILIVSPQAWGEMWVSKHHYAADLASLGHNVYFLGPPNNRLKRSEVKLNTILPRLTLIEHRFFFPTRIRFHLRPLYDQLVKHHVKNILNKLGREVDIVWCFETNLYSNLRWFKGKKFIYHPVDQVGGVYQTAIAQSADIIISVSEVILRTFSAIDKPKYLINHGLSQECEKLALHKEILASPVPRPIKVGYIGNLLIKVLDRHILQQIIINNPEVIFYFWGSYEPWQTNLGGYDSHEVTKFIDFLKTSKNVSLQGVVNQQKLMPEIQAMDAFLVCYNIKNDPNEGSNSHKILEYLSTGKVVIANHVSSYRGLGMLVMPESKENDEMPKLFQQVITNISEYNSVENQTARIAFALRNTYEKHIERILSFLN